MQRLASLSILVLLLACGCRIPHVPLPVRPASIVPGTPDAPKFIEPASAASLDAVSSQSPLFDADQSVIAITESECAARAMEVDSRAQLIEIEQALSAATLCCGKEDASLVEALRSRLLDLQATKRREEAAAATLQSFYQLARLEGQGQRIRASLALLDEAKKRAERLDAEGIDAGQNSRQLGRQWLAAKQQEAKLEAGLMAAREELVARFDLPADGTFRFWPAMDWNSEYAPVDVESATAIGLAHRSELKSMEFLLRCPSKAGLPVLRALLQQAEPTIGIQPAAKGILARLRCGDIECGELGVRVEQLEQLLESQRTSIAAEIRAAAWQIESSSLVLAAQHEIVDSLRREIDALEKQAESADSSVFELTAAKLSLLEAESELVAAHCEKALALLQLQQAKGTVRQTYGSTVPHSWPAE